MWWLWLTKLIQRRRLKIRSPLPIRPHNFSGLPELRWTAELKEEAQSWGFSSNWRSASNYAPMLVVDLKTPYPQHYDLALSTCAAETPERMNGRERGEYKEGNLGIKRQGLIIAWFSKRKSSRKNSDPIKLSRRYMSLLLPLWPTMGASHTSRKHCNPNTTI